MTHFLFGPPQRDDTAIHNGRPATAFASRSNPGKQKEPAQLPFSGYPANLRYAGLTKPLREPEVKPALHKMVLSLRSIDLRLAAILAVVTAVIALSVWLVLRWRRPSAEEIERRRRVHLSEKGRITDGFILDARTLAGEESISEEPEVLVYSYRLAGVVYNCAQDVSMLAERVRGFRLDQPVQVRYDPHNPGNSVLVSEVWTGLRTPGSK